VDRTPQYMRNVSEPQGAFAQGLPDNTFSARRSSDPMGLTRASATMGSLDPSHVTRTAALNETNTHRLPGSVSTSWGPLVQRPSETVADRGDVAPSWRSGHANLSVRNEPLTSRDGSRVDVFNATIRLSDAAAASGKASEPWSDAGAVSARERRPLYARAPASDQRSPGGHHHKDPCMDSTMREPNACTPRDFDSRNLSVGSSSGGQSVGAHSGGVSMNPHPRSQTMFPDPKGQSTGFYPRGLPTVPNPRDLPSGDTPMHYGGSPMASNSRGPPTNLNPRGQPMVFSPSGPPVNPNPSQGPLCRDLNTKGSLFGPKPTRSFMGTSDPREPSLDPNTRGLFTGPNTRDPSVNPHTRRLSAGHSSKGSSADSTPGGPNFNPKELCMALGPTRSDRRSSGHATISTVSGQTDNSSGSCAKPSDVPSAHGQAVPYSSARHAMPSATVTASELRKGRQARVALQPSAKSDFAHAQTARQKILHNVITGGIGRDTKGSGSTSVVQKLKHTLQAQGIRHLGQLANQGTKTLRTLGQGPKTSPCTGRTLTARLGATTSEEQDPSRMDKPAARPRR
jgi:hypothetical protein